MFQWMKSLLVHVFTKTLEKDSVSNLWRRNQEREIKSFDELSGWSVLCPTKCPSVDPPLICFSSVSLVHRYSVHLRRSMDYSYLNQAAAAAAAGFEASSCALAASEMQCGYGDLSSCSQMSQAAYRYTAARAAGYPANAGTTSAGSATPLGAHHTTHSHAHAHHGAHTTPCSVMAARSQEVHRHAASIFPSAINLQSECA